MDPAPTIPLAWLPPGVPFLAALGGLLLVALALRAGAVRAVGRARFVRVTGAVESGALTVFFLSLLGASVLQILLRNLFQTGLTWIDPFSRHLVLWITFLGAFAATARARHVAIDLLAFLAPGPRRALQRRAVSLLAAAVCCWLADGAFRYLRQEAEFGGEVFLGLRSWVVQSILLFGFCLLAYRFLVTTVFNEPLDEATAGESAAEAR